tara:strand:- start:861 stop:986 length:126 start_codon:yes stop_codon:yes gene_type:complete
MDAPFLYLSVSEAVEEAEAAVLEEAHRLTAEAGLAEAHLPA